MSQITSEFDSANNLYAAALYYKDKKLRFGAEYNVNELEGFNKTVMSFMGAYKFDSLTLLARYDIFDPDDSVDKNCINLIIVGIGHKISKLVQVMVDVQYKLYESEYYDDDIKLYVHWEVKF
jgi:hypothetical protein